jgi:phenylacetate-CoA ligase
LTFSNYNILNKEGKMAQEFRKYWDPEIETMSRKELEEIQEKRVKIQSAYVYEYSALQRELWDKAGVKPTDIRTLDDFKKYVPFINKQMVRDYRERTGDPFGGILCLPLKGLRLYITTGSTGAPTFPTFSLRDRELIAEYLTRAFWGIGLRPGDSFAWCPPPEHASIGIAPRLLLQKIGVSWYVTIHHHPLDAARFVHAARYLKPKFTVGVSGLLYAAAMEVCAMQGLDAKEIFSCYEGMVWFGETLAPTSRKVIEENWGTKIYIVSGLADWIAHPLECEMRDSFLHMYDDHFLCEVIDPKTEEPVSPGERGELVISVLQQETAPVLRWKTDDIVTINPEPCPCGRTHTRLTWIGRKPDEVKIAGKSVFPVDVCEVVTRCPETEEGQYWIIKYAPEMDKLKVKVAYNPAKTKDLEALRGRLTQELKKTLGLESEITEFITSKEAPAVLVGHKLARVVDLTKG